MIEPVWAIGLMSGTSGDGIDAALLKTDGERIIETGPGIGEAYDPAFRARLKAAYGQWDPPAGLERELTERHAAVVLRLVAEAGKRPVEVGLVGFHGQTILHEPERHRTRQIGDGALLAELTGLPVVNDFRSADMAAGGEGAPFAPVYHRALAAGLEKPVAMLNIGGVSNVTWIGEGDALIAFDTGPGNALIDDWAMRHTGEPVDRDGALAKSGVVDEAAVARFLENPYFERPAPKSLDRDAFKAFSLGRMKVADGAATLTAITAASIAAGVAHLPAPPKRWLVCGGGRHNPALMEALRARLGVAVDPIEAIGWDGDLIEAQAFAFMAVRSRRGLPISFPGTTGVKQPMSGGRLHQPPARTAKVG
ncbi:anhydro-N-acetylmuramic acid kinase [Dongia sedimenti]|uniref:Anhydro-N-acetylmuramic acid kinase n=1 Tax=Dongia sedimenti TaxID=3064282 RepID=A0ABU0YK82_9PROT|nr:anhydro-N-acetylmuramic acid kinase [Rhodospirillaceae bacterium R-7]